MAPVGAVRPKRGGVSSGGDGGAQEETAQTDWNTDTEGGRQRSRHTSPEASFAISTYA